MTRAAPRLSFDTLVYGIGGSAARLVSILFLPIFTRVLSVEEFGAYDLLTTATVLLTLFGTAGLNSALLFHYRRTDDLAERRSLVGSALVVATAASVVLALIGLVVSEPIATHALGDSRYSLAVALTFVTLPATVASFLVLDLLRLEFRPVAYSIIGIGRSILAGAVGVVLVVAAGMGVAGLLAAQGALAAVAVVVGLWITRGSWRPAVDVRMTRRMLKFGVPLVPMGLAYWLMAYSDRFFLEAYRDLAAVGIYGMASRLAQVVQLAAGAFQMAWWPFAYSRAEDPGHRELFARIFRAYAVGILLFAAVLGLFARELLLLFTTPAFLPAYPYVAMLAFVLAINGCYQVVSIGVALAERTWHQAWTSALAAGLNIGLNVVLIPVYGILGAAISTIVAYLVSTTLVYWMAQRNYRIPYDVRAPLAITVAGTAVWGGAMLLDGSLPGATWAPSVTAVKLAGAVVLAALALWLLRVTPRDLVVRLRAFRSDVSST